MKVLILCWFDTPLESIKSVTDFLQTKGVETKCLGRYVHPFDLFECVCDEIEQGFDTILVWNRSFTPSFVSKLREVTDNLYLFNWDDPHSIKTTEIYGIAPFFDKVFSSCESCREKYLSLGAKEFYYLPPCYGTDHFPDFDSTFQCDIAFTCTNMYRQFKNQRYEICQSLEKSDLDFCLYGPEKLKKDFPRSYRQYILYNINRKLFSSAKICLSTHVQDGKYYLNERDITILASGGLLLTDKITGMEDILSLNGELCYIVLEKDIVSQVKKILENYDQYLPYRQRGIEIVKKFHVSEWCRKVFNV